MRSLFGIGQLFKDSYLFKDLVSYAMWRRDLKHYECGNGNTS